ncbi:DUF58 domain-containing protein [Pseudochelatococcus sp. B33]
MKPSPQLLDRLAGARLRITSAEPSVNAGERRSRALGAGLEFAGHRPYREGDDVRHLDPRLMARLGDPWVRQYAVDRKLPVFVLLDASASMLCGSAARYELAAMLAQLFCFVALASGDQVQLGFAGDNLRWSQRLHGSSRAGELFAWLERQQPGGDAPFSRALQAALGAMPPSSLVVMLSDWLDDAIDGSLKPLAAAGHELVAVHIATSQDMAPVTQGAVMMTDSETGEPMAIVLDDETIHRYRQAFDGWQQELSATLTRLRGRYFLVGTDTDPARFFLHTLRAAGLLG